jgi:hypothetical protein
MAGRPCARRTDEPDPAWRRDPIGGAAWTRSPGSCRPERKAQLACSVSIETLIGLLTGIELLLKHYFSILRS